MIQVYGRAVGAPKTLADILMADCHLLSSVPALLAEVSIFVLQNDQNLGLASSPTRVVSVCPEVTSAGLVILGVAPTAIA